MVILLQPAMPEPNVISMKAISSNNPVRQSQTDRTQTALANHVGAIMRKKRRKGARWKQLIRVVYPALLALLGGVAFLGALAQPAPTGGGPLPPMPIPADNPQTDAKIKLGRQLYFDGRLSANDEISCATCHDPKTGWAGHDATDTGVGGRVGNRNSGTIVNSGYMKYQFWDGRAGSLEEQALGPIHNPVEMGETLENVVRKLNAIPGYKRQFQEIFHSDVTTDGIAKAIASFERTIASGPSAYDRLLGGDKKALSAERCTEWRSSTAKEHALPAIVGHCSRIRASTTWASE
jgi:hypothetical protein